MDLFGVRTVPFLARRNYHFELRHILPWSVLAGLIEGQFASVLVSKTFHGGDLLIGIATATPFAARLFSLIWGLLCVGRPKVRLLAIFAAGATLCTGIAGAIPTSPAGAIWFIAQMAAAQVLLAGVVTVRSAVWKSNYPHSARGRITARLQRVRVAVGVTAVLAAGWLCDRDPASYRYIFPLAALFGGLSIWVLPHIRIRGEGSELRLRRRPPPDVELRRGFVEPFSLTALLSPGHVFGQMVDVFSRDRRFRHYCLALLMMGLGNLMTFGIAVAVVTRDLRQDDGWGFWISTTLLVALPQLVVLGSMGRWGRMLDRRGVVRLRVLNVSCWTCGLVFGMLGTLVAEKSAWLGSMFFPLGVALFALRGIFNGFGMGGGALAWHLGHLHFAKPHDAEIYMGVHVALTGLRGLIGPLGGIWLWRIMGWPVWLIAISLALGSMAMYVWMARNEGLAEMPTTPAGRSG